MRLSSPIRNPSSVVERLLGVLPLAVVVGLALYHLRSFLGVYTLPSRGDPSLPFQGSDLTPLHFPALHTAALAVWKQLSGPFWNPFVNGGAPLFEVPEIGGFTLTTLLGAVLPIEAAIKWGILAHIVAGIVGVYVFARALGASRAAAAAGGFAFAFGTYLLDHFRPGHLGHIQPMGLMVWMLYAFWRALGPAERRAWRWAVLAGALLGLIVLEGGSSPAVYSIPALALAAPAALFGARPVLRLSRAVLLGLLAGAAAFAVAAPLLFPLLDFMALSGRGGGMPFTDAWSTISEVANPMPGTAWLVLAVLGAAALGARGEWRTAVWLSAAVALGMAAAQVESVFYVLWRFVPGFNLQRIPQRSFVLVGVAGPVLVALGAQAARDLLERWRWVGLAVFAAALAWLGAEAWKVRPPLAPMYAPRLEQESNHAMRWLAGHALGSRVHVWESPNRHWSTDNVTVPLGLEVITSYTTAEHRDYLPSDYDPPGHRTFISESYADPAKYWGMLNVRYVLSSSPRAEPGFRLATRVAACPLAVCMPAKSSGTYIYENERWLPRAWRVPKAVALVGTGRPAFEAALDVMRHPAFDPRNAVVLQVPSLEGVSGVDLAFSVNAPVSGALTWGTAQARDELGHFLASPVKRPSTEVRVARSGFNRFEVDAPGEGWLVVSEKASLYPGWRAWVDGRREPIVRANGVLSAIVAPPGAHVRFGYRPNGFGYGMTALLLGVLAFGAAVILEARPGWTDALRRRGAAALPRVRG